MKWWFSSWNLFLFSLSKVCRITSADCFISGFTASQSTLLRLRSIVGYTLLNSRLFCFAFSSKFFSTLCIEKHSWKNHFQLVSDFIFCLLHFVLLSVFLLRVHERQIISLLILESFNLFAGVLCKSFLSSHYNWKVPRRLSGYFTKILQKNCREIFPTTACKKEVRLYQTSFFALYFLIVFYFLL